jgi:polar amino acid transport system permease protein
VNYTFQFGVVWRDFGALMQGALLTFELGVLAFWGGALIGLAFAALKTFGGRVAAWLVDAYVVFITNTPALIQIYFLYFGLPEVGVRWSSEACLLIGLTVNAEWPPASAHDPPSAFHLRYSSGLIRAG